MSARRKSARKRVKTISRRELSELVDDYISESAHGIAASFYEHNSWNEGFACSSYYAAKSLVFLLDEAAAWKWPSFCDWRNMLIETLKESKNTNQETFK